MLLSFVFSTVFFIVNLCVQRFRKIIDLLKEMKFLMENYGRNMEELNDERWTTVLTFIVRECLSNNISKV